MAALYLQNTVHSPGYEPNSSLLPHRRNDSSNSGTTTLQGSSDHSQPLLQHDALEESTYPDLLSRQAPHIGGPRPQWTASLSLAGDTIDAREHKSLRGHDARKRLRWLRRSRSLLEVVIAAFSVYTTVRYFLAFTIYESFEGQATSLSLGICTGAVFAFIVYATALWLFQPYLLALRVAPLLLLRTRITFHSVASLLLFAPTVVNTVMLFEWKNSSNLELNIRRRCHVDIDVIWSVSSTECQPPAWGIWIALSFLRLVFTIIIIILYHWVSTTYHRMYQTTSSQSRRARHVQGIASESYFPTQLPSMSGLSPPSFAIPQPTRRLPQHESSESTLFSIPHSKNSSNHISSPSMAVTSVYSYEDIEANFQQPGVNLESPEVALDDYHEHFRALVCQITRETEEALALAVTDPVNADADADVDASPPTDLYLSRIPPAVGYDEFGRPYPADEHVPILNGYVRRMPTIESMGSREMGSMASSVMSHGDTVTTSIRSVPISRPPTRANTLESNFGSRPSSSRSNSIAAGAEILLGTGRTSEVGELVDSGAGNAKAGTTVSSGSSHPSTMSYYTATSNSYTSSTLPTTR